MLLGFLKIFIVYYICMCDVCIIFAYVHVWMNIYTYHHTHESFLFSLFLGLVLIDVWYCICHHNWMATLWNLLYLPPISPQDHWDYRHMFNFMCILGIWTWVLIHVWSAFYILNGLRSRFWTLIVEATQLS